MRAKKGANVSVIKTRSNHWKWNILPFGKTNVLLQEQTKAMQCQHPGNSFCANTPKTTSP
jgi:phosphomethylpyrimidine synthase